MTRHMLKAMDINNSAHVIKYINSTVLKCPVCLTSSVNLLPLNAIKMDTTVIIKPRSVPSKSSVILLISIKHDLPDEKKFSPQSKARISASKKGKTDHIILCIETVSSFV